jgi:cytochrome oxidase Cu insertion factor (SCO1/SenC/PrrC family)
LQEMIAARNSSFAPDGNSDIVMCGKKMFAEVKIMKRRSSILSALVVGTMLVAGSMSFAQQQPAPAQQQPNRTIPHTNLKVGDMAPDFTLPDSNFKQVKLSDFRGKKNVILAFYVLAFTGG